jgi:hypothetical protein
LLQDLLDAAHARFHRRGGHLPVGVVGDAAEVVVEEDDDFTEFAKFAAGPVKVEFPVLLLGSGFDGSAIVEQPARHLQEVGIFLDFIGMFQESAHHP